jgi:hypothetical protein
MAYATVSNVEALDAARTFTPANEVTDTDVVGFLTETAAVLDGILTARGYTLPVPTAATSALELLEGYNAIGAWAFVEQAATISPHRDAAAQAWANAQRMLRDGLIEPAGLTKDTASSSARAPAAATAFFSREMIL